MPDMLIGIIIGLVLGLPWGAFIMVKVVDGWFKW